MNNCSWFLLFFYSKHLFIHSLIHIIFFHLYRSDGRYNGPAEGDAPLHYWGRHLDEPRPVGVVTGNTAYVVQPWQLDEGFWRGLGSDSSSSKGASGGGSGGGSGATRAETTTTPPAVPTGARFMDDGEVTAH